MLKRQQRALAEAIVACYVAQQPAAWQSYGEEGRQKSGRDAGYHLTYLAEAIAAQDCTLFTEYVPWVKVLFAGLNFPDKVLADILAMTRTVLRERLASDQAALADESLAAGLARLDEAPRTLNSVLEPAAPLADLARQYLDALLRGERRLAASQLVRGAAS